MWWAGEHVLYYYGGHLMAATLSHLTGTAPRYAYNLALSGFYASLVTAAYGLGSAIADSRSASGRIGGTFAAFFVGFASNLIVPVTGLIWLLPDSTAAGVANWVADGLRNSDGNLAHAGELVQGGLEEFGYWAPSRVIPGTINEFPLFAFYNGDLHGHMLSTQFLLLIAALGFAYYRTPPGNRRRRRALAFGVLPVVVALLGLVNTWSLPTGLGVAWLALMFAPADPGSLFPGFSHSGEETPVSDGGESVDHSRPGAVVFGEARRIATALIGAAAVCVLAVAWLSPFVVGILLQSAGNRSFNVLPEPSSETALLLVHGAFLLVFGLYLWPRTREAFDVNPARFGLLAALVVLVSWLAGYPVLTLVVPLLALGWLLLRVGGDAGYETVLLVAGAGLVTIVEFAYVEDGAISGRFNTVFKVYMQMWVLWGTAAGAMAAALLSDRSGPGNWSRSVGAIDVARPDLMAVVVAALLVSTSLYGGFTMRGHFTSDGDLVSPDDKTLDGLAYLDTYHPNESGAIHWLDAREGQPHVVTAPGKPYDWYSQVPSLTGLPAVVGWVYQEGAYRGYDAAEFREREVNMFYTGRVNGGELDWNNRAEILEKYDVRYIYVGPVERETYPNADLNFAQYPGIKPVFENDGVTIYRVNRSELSGDGRTGSTPIQNGLPTEETCICTANVF
jgi:YYY domain-containing protein